MKLTIIDYFRRVEWRAKDDSWAEEYTLFLDGDPVSGIWRRRHDPNHDRSWRVMGDGKSNGTSFTQFIDAKLAAEKDAGIEVEDAPTVQYTFGSYGVY